MSVEVTGLNLNVTANSSNVKGLANDLGELKTALKSISKADSKKLDLLAESATKFATKIGSIDTGKIAQFAEAMAQLTSLSSLKLGNGITKLTKSIEGLDLRKAYGQINALTRILNPLADSLTRIADSAERARSALSGLKITKSLSTTLTGETSQTTEKVKGSTKSISDYLNGAYKSMKQFLSVPEYLKPFVKGINAGAVAVGNFAGTVRRGLSPLFNPFKNLISSVTTATERFKKFFSSLKRIAVYRLIRTVLKEISKALKEGIENLYQWSKLTGGDFAKAMDTISTAMLYFKNSVAAAISPLITYFAPIIDQAIDKIVQLINVVNQFFARITGRATWTAALKYPTEYAEKVAGATKKMKDNLQSFDELHVLTTPSDGGAGNALDYNNMFEERDFDEEVSSWITDFKKAIADGDWEGAGKVLGEKINSVFSSIDWAGHGTSLGKKITNAFTFAYSTLKTVDGVAIGKDIATFLNNVISNTDMEVVGKTLARKITLAVDFMWGFLKKFDFIEAGKKASEFVKGWFEEIDGERIGETISLAIKGALDFGIEFLSDDEMIDEFVEDVVGLINGVDWYGIAVKLFTFGEKLAEAIAKVIIGIFTGESFSTTSTIQSGVPISVPKKQTFSESIGSQLADAIMATPTDGIASAFGKILGLALASAITTAEWIEKPITNNLGGIISDILYGGHLDDEGNFEDRNWKWSDFDDAFASSPVTTWLGGGGLYMQKIQPTISGVFDAFGNLAQNLAHAGDKEEHTWSGTWFSDVTSELEGMVEAAKGAKQGARRYFPDIKKTGVSNFSALSTAIGESSKGILNYVSETVNSMQTYLEANHINTTAKVGETANAISSKMGETASSIKSGFTSALTTVNNAFTASASNAKTNVDSIKSGAIASIESLAKGLGNPLSSVKSTITTAFSDTKSNVDSKVNSLTSSVVKKFGTMNSDVKSKLDACNKDWTNEFTKEKGINASLSSAAKACADGITSGLSEAKSGGVKAMEGFRDSIKKPMNDVIGFSETMGNSVAKSFNKVIDSLNSIKATTPDWLPDKKLANKTWSMSIDKIKTIEIPKLATGGVVTSPTTALIGEAGKEAVVPLDRNTGWMDEIAMRVSANNAEEVALLREQNMYLQEIAGKEFGISPQAIFESVRKENANFIKRTGRTALVY